MTKGKDKRGLVAPRPAAALAALDFAHASEAYRRAMALPTPTEDAFAAAEEVRDQCADRLLAIPTTNPAQIAEKVSAYAYRHVIAPAPLSDQATQWRIAESDDDAAKGLLAIYLDLMATGDRSDAAPPPFDPAAFLTDLLAADLSVIVEPRGPVSELYFNADKPRHANADAMAARFDDLTGHDRRALAAYIRSLGK